MVSLGGFPGVIHDPEIEGVCTIYGEVWHFDPARLDSLDWLEGYPRFYTRSKFRTDLLDQKVWMYHLNTTRASYADHAPVVPACWEPVQREINVWKSRGVEVATKADG